jgi:DNA replication protein DnaC
MFLHGPPGTGKTCAALCLLDFAGGEYYTVSGLHDLLIRAQHGRLEWSRCGHGGTIWPETIWAKLARAPLVVLDELGCRERVSDAHYETVKRCIDERHNRAFIVISNLTLADVASVYDNRIFSRLGAGTVLELAGKDRRLADS